MRPNSIFTLLLFGLLVSSQGMFADPFTFQFLQNGAFAYGINDASQIVISSDLRGPATGGSVRGPSTFIPLSIEPSGISNNGLVVGGGEAAKAVGTGYGHNRGGLDTEGGSLYNNGVVTAINVPGAVNTFPTGVNNAGLIVGSYAPTSNSSLTKSFLYSNGTFSDFNVPGSNQTVALGVNDAGQIVGYSNDSGGNTTGFLDSNGVFTQINYPGAAGTYPTAINDKGQVVGYYYLPNNTLAKDFLYANGTYSSVDFDPSALAGYPSNLRFFALGMNDAGVIVGGATNGNAVGGTFAFEATPLASPTPEPASIFLVASALFGAGVLRRRSQKR